MLDLHGVVGPVTEGLPFWQMLDVMEEGRIREAKRAQWQDYIAHVVPAVYSAFGGSIRPYSEVLADFQRALDGPATAQEIQEAKDAANEVIKMLEASRGGA